MIEILFAFIASLLKGAEKVTHKFILTREDTLGYLFIFQLIGGLLYLPLFVLNFELPKENVAYLIVIVSSILWASVGYFAFKSYSLIDVSLKAPIDKSRLFFALIIGIIFLGETLTISKVIGTILIFFGIVLVTYKKKETKSKTSTRGVVYSIIAALIMATVLSLDKYAMNYFNAEMYPFLVFFLPVFFLAPFVINRIDEVKSVFKNSFKWTFLVIILAVSHYYLILKAFQYLEATVVIPILELSALFAVLGGIIILKERENMGKKIIATIICMIGAVLVTGIF